ncbi:MAG: hypothetical protein M5R41_11800 [Bacteroidia bacterium]|nr:hypothetical protein [Bacteroidia bacterium]
MTKMSGVRSSLQQLSKASWEPYPTRRWRIIGGIVIALFTALWFFPQILIQNDFRTDDFYLFAVLGESGLVWPWESGQYLNFMGFRLVSMILFLGQLQLFGTMALGYYVVGLLFHILAVLLFYALLLTTMEHFVGQTHVHIAVFTTLVLSVHADAFYNVLWISNQTETLALLLCMLYLLLMLRYLASGMLVHALSGMLILFIGFFVKFSIVVLPFLFTVMAVVYWRSARTSVRRSMLVLVAVAGVLLSFAFVGFWFAFDRYDEVLSFAILPTKLFSTVAIMMIALHPWVAEMLYPFMYEQRIVALLLGALGALLLFLLLRKLSREHRTSILIALVLLLIAVLPRAVHQIAPRINTLQIAVLLLLLSIGFTMYRPRLTSWVMGLLLLSHLAGSLVIIPRWRGETANVRYVRLLHEETEMATKAGMLLVHQTIFDQYAIHFYRTGRFGKDTLLQVSPVRLLRKYGVRSRKEYDIRRDDKTIELVATDIRTGFMADTTVARPPWLDVTFSEPLRDYGYRRARLDIAAAPKGLRLLVERGFAYEGI